MSMCNLYWSGIFFFAQHLFTPHFGAPFQKRHEIYKGFPDEDPCRGFWQETMVNDLSETFDAVRAKRFSVLGPLVRQEDLELHFCFLAASLDSHLVLVPSFRFLKNVLESNVYGSESNVDQARNSNRPPWMDFTGRFKPSRPYLTPRFARLSFSNTTNHPLESTQKEQLGWPFSTRDFPRKFFHRSFPQTNSLACSDFKDLV